MSCFSKPVNKEFGFRHISSALEKAAVICLAKGSPPQKKTTLVMNTVTPNGSVLQIWIIFFKCFAVILCLLIWAENRREEEQINFVIP